jgi:AraC-like DNA-binding protein
MPGPCPVIGFQLSGRIEAVRDGSAMMLDRSGVTGIQAIARRFRPVGVTRTMLLTLEPWAAFAMLGHDMHEIAGAHVPLAALLPAGPVREAESRLVEARDEREMADAVAGLLRMRRTPHPAVVQACRHITQSNGGAAGGIDAVARHVGMSRRQLERLFRAQVGVRPKEFASLVRFRWVLANLERHRSWSDLALAAGYSDQAHFVRSFTRRAGMTPTQFR